MADPNDVGGMRLNLTDSTIANALIQFTEIGARSLCPFCIGRMIASVSAGDRILILKGMFAGHEAIVSDEPWPFDGEFLVKFDCHPRERSTRIHYRRDEFVYSPLNEIPKWLCSLSIDDLCAIENAILEMEGRRAEKAERLWSARTSLPLIETVWQRRLPVTAADLWLTLESHGISRNLRADFCRVFDFGIQILISLHGRPAIQKKRVRAMSVGRYLTPGRERYLGPSPGVAS